MVEEPDQKPVHKAGFAEELKVVRVAVLRRAPCKCDDPRIDPYAGYSDVGEVCHRHVATHARCTRCAGQCPF